MVLNNVTKFLKILIRSIRLRKRAWFQIVNFHKQMPITTESNVRYGPIIKPKENIMVLNNVTKFHKILIRSIRLRERSSFQMVNFHKQMPLTPEGMVHCGPLSN